MAALSAVKNKKAAKMREGDLRFFLVQSFFKSFLYVKLFVFGVLVGRCLGTKEGKRILFL